MRHIFKHKGYFGEVYFSIEDECYIGRVLGIKSMLAVHEDSASETIKELIESIDDYLLLCAEEKRMPNTTDPFVAREMEALMIKKNENDINVVENIRSLVFAH